MSDVDTPRYVRANEAAAMLGLKAQTLARWRCEGGKIPFARLGRAIVYDVRDIEAFAESRKRRSTSDSETCNCSAPPTGGVG